MKIIGVKEETARILVNAGMAKLVESSDQDINDYMTGMEEWHAGGINKDEYARLKFDYAKMKEEYTRQRAQLDQIAQILAKNPTERN